jgi:FkbM family methyltransferase
MHIGYRQTTMSHKDIKKFVFKFFLKVKMNITSVFVREIVFRVGVFPIRIPARHTLPYFLKFNKKYDAFLPHFVKYLPEKSIVIDVGANVGDTLALMISSNSEIEYLGIEGSDKFFNFLERNIIIFNSIIPDLKVSIVKELVGISAAKMSLRNHAGTASLERVLDSTVSLVPLDVIIPLNKKEFVELIKIDTDGFDYLVLESSFETLKCNEPMLFFELQYEFDWQYNGYVDVFNRLRDFGYIYWVVFDNFGSKILTTSSLEIVFDLMEYVKRMNIHESSRTIFYFDVLGCTEKNFKLVSRIIDEF